MCIRKYHILSALIWLVANNLLYNNIKINQHLLNTWEDKFLSSDINDNIVYCDPNHYKYMGYAVGLYNSNYENDHDITIVNTGIEWVNINNGSVYSNINDICQNQTLYLLTAIYYIKATASALDIMTRRISYCNKAGLFSWMIGKILIISPPHFFAYFYLESKFIEKNGNGQYHLKLRPNRHLNIILISKWLLFNFISSTNSIMIRFAHDPVFIFAVYDVIHRHKVVLGNSLLIKSGVWDKTER